MGLFPRHPGTRRPLLGDERTICPRVPRVRPRLCGPRRSFSFMLKHTRHNTYKAQKRRQYKTLKRGPQRETHAGRELRNSL